MERKYDTYIKLTHYTGENKVNNNITSKEVD